MPRRVGFFRSLFDFSFTHFVTGKLIRFLYVVSLILLVCTIAVGIYMAFQTSQWYGLITAFIIAPAGFFLYTIWIRVMLEITFVVFRIADDVRLIAHQACGKDRSEDPAPSLTKEG